MTAASLTDRLLDDAALLHPAAAATRPSQALAAHQELRRAAGSALGTLVVPEQVLGALSQVLQRDAALPVQVVASSGAGSLLALGRRELPGLTVVAARIALRDLSDLAANAARVVAATSELPDAVQTLVELPPAPGWVAAAEAVEAAGLTAAVGAGTPGEVDALVEQLSVLVELDLPFVITAAPGSPAAVLLAVEALVDGAEPVEAAALLTEADPERLRSGLARQDDASASRIRRRLRSIGYADVAAALDQLSTG